MTARTAHPKINFPEIAPPTAEDRAEVMTRRFDRMGLGRKEFEAMLKKAEEEAACANGSAGD